MALPANTRAKRGADVLLTLYAIVPRTASYRIMCERLAGAAGAATQGNTAVVQGYMSDCARYAAVACIVSYAGRQILPVGPDRAGWFYTQLAQASVHAWPVQRAQ